MELQANRYFADWRISPCFCYRFMKFCLMDRYNCIAFCHVQTSGQFICKKTAKNCRKKQKSGLFQQPVIDRPLEKSRISLTNSCQRTHRYQIEANHSRCNLCENYAWAIRRNQSNFLISSNSMTTKIVAKRINIAADFPVSARPPRCGIDLHGKISIINQHFRDKATRQLQWPTNLHDESWNRE